LTILTWCPPNDLGLESIKSVSVLHSEHSS